MLASAGHKGQPPLKRLKNAKTLFDYGVKRNAVDQGRGQSDCDQADSLSVRSQVNSLWSGGSSQIATHVSSTPHIASSSPHLAETSKGSLFLGQEAPEADSNRVSISGSPAVQVSATSGYVLSQETGMKSKRTEGAHEPASQWQKQAFNAFRRDVESGSPLSASSNMDSSGNTRKKQGYIAGATHAPHRSSSPLMSSPSGLLNSLSVPVPATLPRPFRPEKKNVPSVPGLEYSLEFVSKAEERQIIWLLDSGKFRWRTDIARRTLHFGECVRAPAHADRAKCVQ